MKQRSKVIATSIATIAMCASLAVGGTFALFTSESEVNIAVTSGTVDVKATATNLDKSNLYSQEAAIDGGMVSINNMIPGDSITFDVEIKNYSTVTANYRTILTSEDGGLADALTVTFEKSDDTAISFLGGYGVDNWKQIAAAQEGGEVVETITVTIAFNSQGNDIDNLYQGKNCAYKVYVEAVQGNAPMVDPIKKINANTYEIWAEEGMRLMTGIADATPLGVEYFLNFNLMADLDMNGYVYVPTDRQFINFNGNGHTIENLTAGTSKKGRSGLFANSTNVSNVRLENTTVAGGLAGLIVGYSDGNAVKNVTIAGDNTVSYVAGHTNWGGIGVLAGANHIATLSDVVLEKGAKVTLNYNGMETQFGSYYKDDKLGGHFGNNTTVDENVTDNGATIVKNGLWYNYVANGFGMDQDGNYVICTEQGLWSFASYVNKGNTLKNEKVLLATDIDLMNKDWTPIGTETYKFLGSFDGQNHTISNLSVVKGSGYVGLFAYMDDIDDGKTVITNNLKIHNATVQGSVCGVVAASPKSMNFENITITGKVIVEGKYYTGGAFGYNVYGNVKNVTLNVDEGSYVKADSLQNGAAYRTYVGGVIGFRGEGTSVVENVTSNIDVIGTVCDIGGITGIAHEGNIFRNCVSTGTVTNLNEDVTEKEIGGIAGVWMNSGRDVVFENCKFEGKLVSPADLTNAYNNLVVAAYSSTGSGKLVIDGKTYQLINSQASLESALNNASGETAVVLGSGNYIIPDSAQGKTLTIVGNGDTVVGTQDDGSYEGCDYSLDGATVTFENITINTDSSTYTGYARLKATYNNCTINGAYWLYGESEFNNCTFNVSGDNYNIWTWGAGKATFNGCTFNTDGKSILVYTSSCDVYVNNCTFNDRTNGTGFTKSAIETGVDDKVNTKHNIYITNITVNGFAENDKCVGYENVVGNKDSLTKDNLNIVIDGVDVY